MKKSNSALTKFLQILKLQTLSVLMAYPTLNVALLKAKKAAKKPYLNEHVLIILLQDNSTVFPKPYPQFLLPIILSDLKTSTVTMITKPDLFIFYITVNLGVGVWVA